MINGKRNKKLKQMYAEHGKEKTWKILAAAADYECVPPTIEEFINDPEFLGQNYGFDKDNNRPTIYPYWMEALKEVFPDPFNSPYVEIITTGATGQGKTLFSMIGALYDVCKLCHVKNPHSKYALAKTNKITLMLLNATMAQAKNVLFEEMMMAMADSPFFKKKMALAPKYALLEKNIDIDFGSRAGQSLGRAVFATIISEINFQNKTALQAKENYDGVVSRFKGRFKTDYEYPGRIWVDSSKTETGSFIEETLLKGRDLKAEGVKVFDNARWNVLPSWKLPANTFDSYFDVFKGNENRDPFVIERDSQREGIDEDQILKVPHIYTTDFRDNIQKALQDLGGVSTQASYKFISSVERIDSCFGHENPITKEVISLDMRDQHDALVNYIDFSKLPFNDRPRFLHFDLSFSEAGDRTGIASTRLDGISTTPRLDSSTGKTILISEPKFYVDFVMNISAKSGQEIPLHKLEDFCIHLRAKGYKIAAVSVDSFQSKVMEQNLKLKGFTAEIISVDRALEPYLELKQAIMNERIDLPLHPRLIEELKKLELVKGVKVDHPVKGSKDIADAVAGSVFNAKMKMSEMRANMTSKELGSAINNQLKPKNVYDSLMNQMGLFDPHKLK